MDILLIYMVLLVLLFGWVVGTAVYWIMKLHDDNEEDT